MAVSSVTVFMNVQYCDCTPLPVSSGTRARFTLGSTLGGSGTLVAIGSMFQCISGLHTSNNLIHKFTLTFSFYNTVQSLQGGLCSASSDGASCRP